MKREKRRAKRRCAPAALSDYVLRRVFVPAGTGDICLPLRGRFASGAKSLAGFAEKRVRGDRNAVEGVY